MDYGELHLAPVATGRDATTGRFLKGHVSYNKGKKWSEWMSERSQKRAAKGWKNLDKRPTTPSPNAGRPRRPVIGVMNNDRFVYFPSIRTAADRINGRRDSIRWCCHANLTGTGRVKTDHRYRHIRWYYEDDENWMNKIQKG